jgi:hypothetical protein
MYVEEMAVELEQAQMETVAVAAGFGCGGREQGPEEAVGHGRGVAGD